MTVLTKILFWLLLAFSPILYFAFGSELFRLLKTVSLNSQPVQFFIIGAILFIPSFYVMRNYFGGIWNYLTTLEHEFSHALVALFFLKKPVSMRVTALHGGEFQYASTNTIGQTWISLAPYFLPTLSILVLFLGWLGGLSETAWFYGISGWTIAFHLVTNWQETSFRQSDLQKVGFVKTILVLPIANLLIYGSILAFVIGGIKGFSAFWLEGSKHGFEIIPRLFNFI